MMDPLDDITYHINDTHTHIHTCTLTEKPEEDAIIIERKIWRWFGKSKNKKEGEEVSIWKEV